MMSDEERRVNRRGRGGHAGEGRDESDLKSRSMWEGHPPEVGPGPYHPALDTSSRTTAASLENLIAVAIEHQFPIGAGARHF